MQAPHKQQHTAKRVYDRLKELYGDEFNANERSVRKFVAGIKKELQMNSDGFLPLEHQDCSHEFRYIDKAVLQGTPVWDEYLQ